MQTRLFDKKSRKDQIFLAAVRDDEAMVKKITAILREAAKWKTLPRGWTEESVDKFWSSLTGDVKHKVTKCIEKMKDNVDDPGAFCAALADRVDPGWRSRRASLEQIKDGLDAVLPSSIYPFIDENVWPRFLKELGELISDLGNQLVQGWGDKGWDTSDTKRGVGERGDEATYEYASSKVQVYFNVELKDFVVKIAHDPDIGRLILNKPEFIKTLWTEFQRDSQFKRSFYLVVNKALKTAESLMDDKDLLQEAAAYILESKLDSFEARMTNFGVETPTNSLIGFWADFEVESKGPETSRERSEEYGPDPDDIRDWRRDMEDYRTIGARLTSRIASDWMVKRAGVGGVVKELFTPLTSFAKDPRRFLQEIPSVIVALSDVEIKVEDTVISEWDEDVVEGKQIGGGWDDPPEYQEFYFEVPSEVTITGSLVFNFKELAEAFTADLRDTLEDFVGFHKAFEDALKSDRKFAGKLASIFFALSKNNLKDLDERDWSEIADIGDVIHDETSGDVENIKTRKNPRVEIKPVVFSFDQFAIPVEAKVGVVVEMALPEPDFDEPYPDDDRWY